MQIGQGHLWVRAEGPNFDFPCRSGLDRIHHDRDKRVLELLLLHLGAHIDSGKPTPIARVGVIPPAHVLLPPCSVRSCLKVDHELVRLIMRVHTRLRPFHRQREGVHDNERISHDFPLQDDAAIPVIAERADVAAIL